MAKKYDKEVIIAQYKTGAFSYDDLAYKHKVSKATIGKILKGTAKENKPLIDKIVETKQELNQKNEQEVDAINEQVNSLVKMREFFNNATMKNAQVMMQKVDDMTTHQDHKLIQDTLDKASITVGVNPRGSGVAINNMNAQQNIEEKRIVLVKPDA